MDFLDRQSFKTTVRHLEALRSRGRDDTEYVTEWWRDPDKFVDHWARRLAAAAVTADAQPASQAAASSASRA